jgi:ferredoxin
LPDYFLDTSMTNILKLLPNNVEVEYDKDETIFNVAKRANVKIPTACGGIGQCALCQVKVISGEECINSPTKIEEGHMGNVAHITHKRLACQCKLEKSGTIVVEVL